MVMTPVDMNRLLQTVVNRGISDLHLAVGRPPPVRMHGRLVSLKIPPLTNDDMQVLMKSITSEQHQQSLREIGGTDFGFSFEGKARFRVSLYRQKNLISMVLRLVPNEILNLDKIGLPHHVKTLLTKQKGLILVTGPTGSGKTTTLAAMIDYVNREMDHHLLTIEDPIEFYHDHKKCIVTQREVGVDVGSFSEAIRRGLRQDPDVIMIGEMRDPETIHAALLAAETGHLVMATLHTTGSAHTINRIIDAFPANEKEQVRVQLAQNLVAVVSQLLLPRADGQGRVAAFEIMMRNDAIAHKIRDNKVHTIESDIQTSSQKGMILMDDCLFDLYTSGVINHSEAMRVAMDPEALAQKIQQHKAKT
ncbi:MAG: type IV pilus twitching motility protein PilT [Planctomycetota bacterium]